MRSNRSYLAAISTAVIAGLGLAAPAAFADMMTLDTGIAPWMVTRTEIGGETSPNTDEITPVGEAGNSQTYTAADVSEPFYPHWIQASDVGDGDAQWVSWDASTGMNYEGDNENSAITDDGTSYVYTDTFTLNGAANASLEVSAQLAADNIITGTSLEDDTDLENVPVDFTDNSLDSTNYYFQASSLTAFASGLFESSSPQTFTLTVDVVNWDGSRFDSPEGTGFILDGDAETYVPEPSAILLGVAAAMGTLLRRRRCPGN
jgi:hypothetical protein